MSGFVLLGVLFFAAVGLKINASSPTAAAVKSA